MAMKRILLTRRNLACCVLAMGIGLGLSSAPSLGGEELSDSIAPVYTEKFGKSAYQVRVTQGRLNLLTEEQQDFLFVNRSDFEIELRLSNGAIQSKVLPGALVALDPTLSPEVVVQLSLESGDLKQKVLVEPGQVIYFEDASEPYHIVVELAAGARPEELDEDSKKAERLENESKREKN